MGDCLETPAAAGMGLNADAAKRQYQIWAPIHNFGPHPSRGLISCFILGHARYLGTKMRNPCPKGTLLAAESRNLLQPGHVYFQISVCSHGRPNERGSGASEHKKVIPGSGRYFETSAAFFLPLANEVHHVRDDHF